MSMNINDLTIVVVISMLGAWMLFRVFGPVFAASVDLSALTVQDEKPGPVFLFHDRQLVDATPDALALIGTRAGVTSEFNAMIEVFEPAFPTLGEALENPAGTRLYAQSDPTTWIDISQTAGTLRVAMNGSGQGVSTATDTLANTVQQAELALLRDVSQQSPQLIWMADQKGRLVWANRAYHDFAKQTDKPEQAAIFPDLAQETSAQSPLQKRISLSLPDGEADQWFDITCTTRDSGFLYFASDANAVMRADQARRNFVQTLGKTFAQLATGLAIFDKSRRLAMFNPALVDLTHLPVAFLSARPTIDAVLDRLREARMMPEPKNYTSWRESFRAVERAAKNGTYSENWNLPDGQTFRVTGRPHPDGAFAFLFEDISAEVSLTRRFRSDIETGQAVLDMLPDAIAVFSAAGTLVMSNLAYAQLWRTKAEIMLEHRELQTEMAIWRQRCAPSPIWSEMCDFIDQLGARKPWTDDATLDDGRHLVCHTNPISGGMTMVRFTVAQKARPILRKFPPPPLGLHAQKR